MKNYIVDKLIQHFNDNFILTKIELDEDNRMARAGLGKNGANWFLRVDLWSVGYRLTAK